MAIDFTYSTRDSYRDYLARTNVRGKIELVMRKSVRAAIGPVADLFYANDAGQNAIHDYHYGGPADQFEVLTLQLFHLCGRLGPLSGDLVSGFHALFDEGGVPSTPTPPDGPLGAAFALVADQRYAEAHAALGQLSAAHDPRVEQLRAKLLAGTPGQPRSAAIVDLRAAERAYLSIAGKAEAAQTAEAVSAFVAAGRCAYADGRFRDAKRYFGLALDRDPQCGEANYQMARLRMHAGDRARVRDFLVLAFRAHFSYALRAAGDQLFQPQLKLVEDCVTGAIQRIAGDIRWRIADYADLIETLRRDADPQFGLARIERLPDVLDQFEALRSAPEPATLKPALALEKRVLAFADPLRGVARDYCVMLRKAEAVVSGRGIEAPPPPDDAARARRICGIAVAALTAVAAAASIASLAAVYYGTSEWAVEAAVASVVILMAAVAVRFERAAWAELCWMVERRLVRPRTKRQAEEDDYRRRLLVDDNRARHRARVSRIATRFGLSPG